MKKRAKNKIALALALAAALACLCGCGGGRGARESAPLRVGVTRISGEFSPFFAELDGDAVVRELTQQSLLTTERSGAVVFNAIEGEEHPFNGESYTYTGLASVSVGRDEENDLTSYTFTLRPGVRFSDGVEMDIDDLLFSWLVCLDPAYDGPHRIAGLPIVGLRDYQTRTTGEVYEKYYAMFDDIYSGREQFSESERGAWDMIVEQLWEESGLAGRYASARAYWKEAGTSGNELYESARLGFIRALGPMDPALALNGVSGVSGIERLGDMEARVTLEGYDPDDIYALDVPVAPLHYYGDEAGYDFENANYGFNYGSLSELRSVASPPVGAGPYRLSQFGEGTAVLEFNESYWRGAAGILRVELVESPALLGGVASGTADFAAVGFDARTQARLREINTGGGADADIIGIAPFAAPDYWYIGINARQVGVGDSGSAASKNLRKALATVLAAFRYKAAEETLGARAAVPEYPVSMGSWAYPDPSSESFAAAYSTGLDGMAIYGEGMTDEERVEAAKAAAVDYFVAAGYKYEDGRLVSPPEGASMTYRVTVPEIGEGRQAMLELLGGAKRALDEIGISLVMLGADEDELELLYGSGELQLWCGYREGQGDPRLYEIWEQSQNSPYGIRDASLQSLLDGARAGFSQQERIAAYAQSMDMILDWAVELPAFQLLGCYIYSAETIEEMPPGLTPYWSWTDGITEIQMK